MRSRSFLHVSLGILALAAAFHLGARSAVAQAPGNPIVAVYTNYAFTGTGDVYYDGGSGGRTWEWRGNVFSGGPTPTRQESFGSVKARYR